MTRLARNRKIRESDLQALHREVSRWAMYCVGFNHDIGKEVIQQTYLKIVEGSAMFDGKSTLKTWLYGVVRITALETTRSCSAEQQGTAELAEALEDTAPGADRVVQELHDRQEVGIALAQLSLMQREIIYLVFYREMALSEVSIILDVGIGTVRKQYHRAKTRLAQLLQGDAGRDIKGELYEKSYS